MRRLTAWCGIAAVGLGLFAAAAYGEEKNPKSDEVIALVGSPWTKVFDVAGSPTTARTTRDVKTGVQSIWLVNEFTGLECEIVDDKVKTCVFELNWNHETPVLGVRMGAARDAVLQSLGEPKTSASLSIAEKKFQDDWIRADGVRLRVLSKPGLNSDAPVVVRMEVSRE